MVHGCIVYTECTETAAASSGIRHITTKQHSKYTTQVDIQNHFLSTETVGLIRDGGRMGKEMRAPAHLPVHTAPELCERECTSGGLCTLHQLARQVKVTESFLLLLISYPSHFFSSSFLLLLISYPSPSHIFCFSCFVGLPHWILSACLQTNVVLMVNAENGEISRLLSKGLPETQPEKRRFTTVLPQVKVSRCRSVPDVR